MAITRFTVVDAGSITWATIAASTGDLILVFFVNDGSDDQSTPSGLTRLDSNDSTGMEGGVYYRIVDETETGDLITNEGTFGITNEEYTAHIIKIPTGEWHGTTAPEATSARGDTGTIDPPNEEASWGSETDNIWIAAGGRDDDNGISSLTANYATNFGYTESSAGAGTCELASSWRTNTAAAENPGTATQTDTDEEWKAWTVAVRPLAIVPIITAVGDDSEPDQKQNVTITGSNFGATDTGSAKVEITDNITYGAGTFEIEIPRDTWGTTSIQVDLQETGTGNPLLDDLTAGTVYCFVTDSAGTRNSVGYAWTLKAKGATWTAAKNADWTQDVDQNFRVRMEIKNTGGNATTPAFKWQYNKNSGGWNDITASSSNVKTIATTYFADGDDLTEQLLGTDTFITNNDAAEESTGTFTMGADLGTNEVLEAEISLTIVSGDVADEDTIDIRIVESDATPFTTYTQTPTITVNEGAPPTGQPTRRRWGGVPGLDGNRLGGMGRTW